jgi:hypothetical protein
MDPISPRRLMDQERELVEAVAPKSHAQPFMIERESPGSLRVVGVCDCGCPSIFFAVSGDDSFVAQAFILVGISLDGSVALGWARWRPCRTGHSISRPDPAARRGVCADAR